MPECIATKHWGHPLGFYSQSVDETVTYNADVLHMDGQKYEQAVTDVWVLYVDSTAACPSNIILCICLNMGLMVLPLTTNYLIISWMSKPEIVFHY